MDVRIKFIRYSDFTCDATSELEKTQATKWYKSDETADAVKYLEDLELGDGGDWKEVALDGMAAMMADNEFGVRSGSIDPVAKFCVLLTDAGYKSDFTSGASYASNYGSDEEHAEKIAEALKAKKINTSLICRTADFDAMYSDFLSEPTSEVAKDGGIFADIVHDDYKLVLEELAKRIEKYTKIIIDDTYDALKIKSNMVVLRKYEGASYSATEWRKNEEGKLVADSTPLIDGQKSCVLKGLEPDTQYTFTITGADGSVINSMTFYTESATGARFN